jgi:hypothetical protein
VQHYLKKNLGLKRMDGCASSAWPKIKMVDDSFTLTHLGLLQSSTLGSIIFILALEDFDQKSKRCGALFVII